MNITFIGYGNVGLPLATGLQQQGHEVTLAARDAASDSAIYAAEEVELEGVSGKYYFKEAEEPRLSEVAQDPVAAETLWNKSMAYLTAFISM